MNKSDLKDGMVVELRNGEKRVIWGKDLYEIFALKLSVCNCLNNYNDDLNHTCTDDKRNLDIMKVSYGDELLWERVDWSKVPVGAKVLYSYDDKEWFEGYYLNYFPKNVKPHYILNLKRNISSDFIYCKLAEEPKEEVTAEELNNNWNEYDCTDVDCEECEY